MKQRVLLLLTLVSAALFLASCDEFPFPGSGDKVVLEETKFSLPAAGGKVEVTFIPVSSWSATCAESFVNITPASGEASEKEITISISVGKNTDTSERVIKVLLTVAEQDIVLTITQDGAEEEPDVPGNPDKPDNPNPPGPGPDDPPGPGSDDDYGASSEEVVPGANITITK